ncbi:DNA cytosine methyltransferase [Streptomyces phage AbbeyMikolon]|uniref:DNA methyltransferase n=1 Tax=Streptomyces phage AbbeyMikolon TaxID=2059880 RepID=A0A2H5BLF6_9CAUD|nr:DNA cytosine methyltransferase [Streptomyces phage AbbeyMikolon]AUG87114.1 DNA methyltransferase [Streptomyces phage AbbeyMikolon]
MGIRVLDLCCCSGGAGVGFRDAGADYVEGWDIVDRPRYPFAFRQGDALEVLRDVTYLRTFDFIHASPPCQAKCTLTQGTNAKLAGRYVDLYPEFRDLMYASGVPGSIENPSSRPDMVLCGEMFGLGVIRHRKFELVNWSAPAPEHVKHRGPVRGWRHGVWRDGPYIAAYGNGGGKGTVAEMQDAMDIRWTDVREELTEAIPPAYTEYVLHQFLAA